MAHQWHDNDNKNDKSMAWRLQGWHGKFGDGNAMATSWLQWWQRWHHDGHDNAMAVAVTWQCNDGMATVATMMQWRQWWYGDCNNGNNDGREDAAMWQPQQWHGNSVAKRMATAIVWQWCSGTATVAIVWLLWQWGQWGNKKTWLQWQWWGIGDCGDAMTTAKTTPRLS